MKFKIKYAEQIVGFFSLLSIACLIILILNIGIKQNWFEKKNHYYTIFDSGSGVSIGMDLTYKGFSIGKINSVSLEGENVRVDYYVLEDYFDYVKENSIVELSVSPIGLGASFIFYPGVSDKLLPNGSELYRRDSLEAKKLIREQMVNIGDDSDSISVLLSKVSTTLDSVNRLIRNINNALEGKGNAPFTEIIGNINTLTSLLSDTEKGAVPNLLGEEISTSLKQTIDSLNLVMNDSKGAVPKLLGNEMANELNAALASLVLILKSTDKLVAGAQPEINEMLVQVNTLLIQVQDLVTGLNNNPLLSGGVPDRTNESSASVNLRSSDF